MKLFHKMQLPALLLIFLVQFVFIPPPPAHAFSNPAAVPLLTVANFAALAHTTITTPIAGTVLNNGDLGSDAACTGFPSPCTASGNGTINNGVIHLADGVASQGQTDATAAVTNIGGRTADQTLLAQLGGQVLTQGFYDVPAAATNLTGDLTLNGDANSVFIFHLTSTLITDSGSRVLLTGGAQACNVFWKVDSSATFNGTTTMVGTVLASASVTFPGGGATLNGRAIAQTAAITFNNTTVNNSSCAGGSSSSSSGGSTSGGGGSEQTPSIHVTKTANPLALPNGAGSVTYTYRVTNTGDLPLSRVTVKDNKCTPVRFISGDRNHDSILDRDEIWTYRCTTTVSQTVTNTVTVHGFAGAVDVHDTAKATVVVGPVPSTAAPKLPNTGIGLDFNSTTLWEVVGGVVLIALGGFYLARKRGLL